MANLTKKGLIAYRKKSLHLKPMKRVRRGVKTLKEPKEKSISKLIKELDTIFSKVVRYGALDENGKVRCYTCGHKTEPKKIHAGHYISRWYKSTRWDKDNVRPQCFMCNIYKKGDAAKFRENLIQEIGLQRVEALEKKTIKIWKRGNLARLFLEEEIKRFAQTLQALN